MAKSALTQSLSSLRPGQGYLRSVEYAALALMLIMVAATSYLTLNVLSERNKRAGQLEFEEVQLKKKIAQLKTDQSKLLIRAGNKNAALESLQQFNERFLRDQRKGQLVMIDLINKLIKKNSLGFAGAIGFQPIEDADVIEARDKQRRTRRDDKDTLDVFPGLRASFGISGEYDNLRTFLHDLETSDLFLIIERLDLQSTEAATGGGGRGQVITGGAPGQLAVQCQLKAYFRKQNVTY